MEVLLFLLSLLCNFIKERIMKKVYIPTKEEIKELKLTSKETKNQDGFVVLNYEGNYQLSIYEKLFDPLKGAVEYVLANPVKGIVFIGKLKSFDELKDQLKRCQLH
jgi:hypothetical protein